MPLWAHLRIKEDLLGSVLGDLPYHVALWQKHNSTNGHMEPHLKAGSDFPDPVAYIRRKTGAEGPRVGVRAALRAACLKHGQKSLGVRLHGAVSLCFGDAKPPASQRQATNWLQGQAPLQSQSDFTKCNGRVTIRPVFCFAVKWRVFLNPENLFFNVKLV